MDQEAMRQHLHQTNEEFRELSDEHRACEDKLDVLASKSSLSTEDETEVKRLKVHKLTLKDRMHTIIRSQAERDSSSD